MCHDGHSNHHLQQLTKLFVSHDYIGVWKHLKKFFTSHVTRRRAVPIFCRLELPLQTYGPLNEIPSFIMLYTGDFVLPYYGEFLQIRSQISS